MGTEDSLVLTPERVRLLGVPLDILPREGLAAFISALLEPAGKNTPPGKGKNIVLLSLWDLLRARRNIAYGRYVLGADLVVPISKSLVSGTRFLKNKIPFRYMPFYFIVDLLDILESAESTVYLLGGKENILRKVENNIRQTFPRLRIVGRRGGSFRRRDEGVIVEAIRRAAPQLILVGQGIRGRELWIARNHDKLGHGLRLWCSDIFDVFAKRRGRPPDKMFEMGLEALFYCLRNPLKIFRIFLYLYYKFLLIFHKLFR